MAEIIPSLNRRTLSRMTAGEKRVAHCLESLLDDSYVVWYDIPVGKRRRFPISSFCTLRAGSFFWK